MLRHSHPTLAGPILDLKRNPAEFCLIDPIVRQVWCDSPTSSRFFKCLHLFNSERTPVEFMRA